MKICSATQFREWDAYTIRHEPVSSIELMERASGKCSSRLLQLFHETDFWILCGPGNNGGDGLAIARQLREAGKTVHVYAPIHTPVSDDHKANRERWKAIGGKTSDLSAFQPPGSKAIIVDALFGTGQNRPPEGIYAELIRKINGSGQRVVAIDMPSGLLADSSSLGHPIVQADLTLTFQALKLAMMVPENEPYTGEVEVLDIGLHPGYLDKIDTVFHLTEKEDLTHLIRPRDKFAHKGRFGSALLMAGSRQMMGAAILSAGACLRAGVGKLYCGIPGSGLPAMQTAVPEAICIPDPNPDMLAHLPELDGMDAIGVGPGIGQAAQTAGLVKAVLDKAKMPVVWDADALNLIAREKWQGSLRKDMVLTPHVGEFSRLFGDGEDGFSRIRTAMEFSTAREVCIILKGRFSFLSTPGGQGYFNPTGNPGMAKAGSGDVLTGIILALLAQKYSIDGASRLGMYVHGLAGDMARELYGEPGILAGDIIKLIGKAFEAILTT